MATAKRKKRLLDLGRTTRPCRPLSIVVLCGTAWLGVLVAWNLVSHPAQRQREPSNAAALSSSTPIIIGDARTPHAGAMLPNWLCWTAHRARMLDFVAVVNEGVQSAGALRAPSTCRVPGARRARARPTSFPQTGCVPGSDDVDVINLLSLAMSSGRGFWYATTDILLLQDVRHVLPTSCDIGYDGSGGVLVGDGLPLAVHPSPHGQSFWARLRHCQSGARWRRGLVGLGTPPSAPALTQACIQHALATPGLTACSWASVDAFMYARSLHEFQAWGPKATGVWPLAVRVAPRAVESVPQGEDVDGVMERPSGDAYRKSPAGPAGLSDAVLAPHNAALSATAQRTCASAVGPDIVRHADAATQATLNWLRSFSPSSTNTTDRVLHTFGLQAVSPSGACHVHPPGVPPPAHLACFVLTIRVLTMARPKSLTRLLRVLSMVDYMGDKVDLVIAVDVPRRGDWVVGWWLLLVGRCIWSQVPKGALTNIPVLAPATTALQHRLLLQHETWLPMAKSCPLYATFHGRTVALT